MHNLLRNPYYMGVIAYNGFHYEGKHPPLVSPETWLRVQDVAFHVLCRVGTPNIDFAAP